jgi:serine/threonine protein kinase
MHLFSFIDTNVKPHFNMTVRELYVIISESCDSDLYNLDRYTLTLDHLKTLKTLLVDIMTKLNARNIYYMDMKPNNIVKCGNSFKVIDYGNVTDFNIRKPWIGGTPGYVSPAVYEYMEKIIEQYIDQLKEAMIFKNKYIDVDSLRNIIERNIAWYNSGNRTVQEIFSKNDMYSVAITLLQLYSYHKIKDQDFLNSLVDMVG